MTTYKDRQQIRALQGKSTTDNRKGDRHKPGYVRPNAKPREYTKRDSKWERRSIVAWDGEGANLDSGEHIYNLLANSKGACVIDVLGLPTLTVFEFLLDNSSDRDINVIFGGSYDVNMILKDMDKDHLQELWNSGRTYWMNYRVMYAPRKKFTIQKIHNKKILKTFVLWDVIGYFQSSFVVACQRWLGNLDVLKDIQEMKDKRSVFKSEDITEIVEYNKKECLLLVLLMERLFASLDEANVQLMRYDGAGSIAAALLKMNNVRNYKGKIPSGVNRQAQYAYSGGRIEAVKCGTTTKPTRIFRYDINSAYPSACLTLPSYIGAKWVKELDWDGTNNSLVCVKYHFDIEAPFYPLWFRDSNGNISYPRYGKGIYWGAEVQNLYKYYQEGKDFEIEWALNCTIKDETKPFEFITDLFELRKKFKAEGSMASESLKLGLNSIYGKLVQQAGYREGRIPTYHQLLWGGQITAFTRAKLFDAAMQSPKDVISFATDAVFTTTELNLDCNGELGNWSFDEFQGITIVQAGVYFLDCSNYHNESYSKCPHCRWVTGDDIGGWYEKFRGFDKGSLQRDEIIQCWKDGTNYEASLTRFVGLGSALMAKESLKDWRTWQTTKRQLDIRPTGKRIAGNRMDYHRGLRVTKACPNITPDSMSEPYAIEWVDGIKGSAKMSIEGVPLEVIVDEIEDGGL